ncbi:MAG: hypothetical protein LBU85_03635 [Treponema sp.]|jgi:hypothetical protein|nr:hypothetical protein [Treponema sp.]
MILRTGSLITATAAGRAAIIFFAAVFIFLSLPLSAQDRTIPLLICEHHADHMEFFFRYGANTRGERSRAAMIVLDAHADTVANEQSDLIQSLAAAGSFSRAGRLAGNHNWIQPLAPAPLEALALISAVRGPPRSDKLKGFLKSTSSWNSEIRTFFLTVEELRFWETAGETLFVSIDLDFFAGEDYGPEDIPVVFDALFSFAARWQGPVIWAVCLSRPWLPDDRCAWLLLDRSLRWLRARAEFQPPEIALFDSRRNDTSRTAQAFRAQGLEPPVLREADAPEQIKALIIELTQK